jgi:DNA-binding GntR family transcriptional regulator
MSVAALDGEADGERADDSVRFAYQRLREQILMGDLAPGAVLSQVQLAQTLGISRTPLREALRRLAAEYLVTGDFNRRMRVSELNLDDLDQIYAMRIALEPVGIRATMPGLDAAGREKLTQHVDGMGKAIDVLDLERFRHKHRAFHLGLTAGSGTRMNAVLEELWDHSERYRLAYLQHDYADRDSASAERLHSSQHEHRSILNAALASDASGCADQLVGHLRRTVDVVFRESAWVPRPRLATAALGTRVETPA